MPELPEVETVARRLRIGDTKGSYSFGTPGLIGWRVSDVNLIWARSLFQPDPAEFARRLVGQTLGNVSRRGKFIVMTFASSTLLAHLRMSGDLRVELDTAPLQPHDRAWLAFDHPGDTMCLRLAFNDPRKFGRLWLVDDPQTVLGGLGPEPLDPPFTAGELYLRLHATTRQLKPLLLDQSFLAGLGNIYTDEALHLARLHPLTPANRVTTEQAGALWAAIRAVLEEGIRRNGASIDWVYRGGDFQNYFRAYQRTGQPCPACGTLIQRIVVGQRGTHFCPTCQPAPG
jgi:formamidopyrimidine-DNA glycosylase